MNSHSFTAAIGKTMFVLIKYSKSVCIVYFLNEVERHVFIIIKKSGYSFVLLKYTPSPTSNIFQKIFEYSILDILFHNYFSKNQHYLLYFVKYRCIYLIYQYLKYVNVGSERHINDD